MNKKRWSLPRDLLEQSVMAMRPHGVKGHEGLCLWFGEDAGAEIRVTHLVVPRGPGLVTHPQRLSLSLRAMSQLTRLAGDLDRYWCGQIHSHPGLNIDLSDVDKEMGILVQDYLSLVCPYYAQRQVAFVRQCGVHVFDSGTYRRLPDAEIDARITVSDRTVEVISLEVLP